MAKNPNAIVLVPARETRWLDGISVVREKYQAAMEAGKTAARLLLDFAQSYARALSSHRT